MKLKRFLPICLSLVFVGCSSDDAAEFVSSCPIPVSLTAINITGTTADLSWLQTAETATYDIELGLAGFTFSGEPTHKDIPNPFTVTNLTPETNYEFYVRTKCENGETSDWAGPYDFSTTIVSNTSTNYFPLKEANYWSYNNEREIQGESPETGFETMSVASSTENNGTVYYDLETDQTSNIGFMTIAFSNGELSKTNGQLLFSGELELIDIGTSAPITLSIDNVAIYDVAAEAGTELFNYSGTIEQDFTYQGQTFPISVNYTISTHNMDLLETYVVDGTSFEDVLVADIKLSASLEVTVGPVQVTLIEEQEIVNAVNYYAEGVGMVHSDVSLDAVFADLSAVGFPQIPPIHIESSQKIDSYNVIAE